MYLTSFMWVGAISGFPIFVFIFIDHTHNYCYLLLQLIDNILAALIIYQMFNNVWEFQLFTTSLILFSLVLPVFVVTATLLNVKWYLIVILIYISLMMNGVEHLFLCLFAILVFSLVKPLFKSFLMYIGLFGFLLLSCDTSSFYLQVLCQI
jgi:hypothetical protein